MQKIDYKQFEKWVLLDSSINDTLMLDQILLLKSQSNAYHANTCKLPGKALNLFFMLDLKPFMQKISITLKKKDTIKFIFETSNLDNINPSIINKVLLIVQQDLNWRGILDSRLYTICLQYSVPQAK